MDDFVNISDLKERAKELNCLYLIDEALTKDTLTDILMEISMVTPTGFCDFKECNVAIVLDEKIYTVRPIAQNSYELKSDIIVNGKKRGYIKATYPPHLFAENELIFLPQEQKLLNSIGSKISQVIDQKFNQNYYNTSNWRSIVELLKKTNQKMLYHICEKMITLMATKNQKKIEDILAELKWVSYD